jgi:hypothetical protein
MKVLREHRTGLLSVSETFTGDPLVQWHDKNEELREENLKVRCWLQPMCEAMLNLIHSFSHQCRLPGVMIKGSQPLSESGFVAFELSFVFVSLKTLNTCRSRQVQSLIQEAKDVANLCRMYYG